MRKILERKVGRSISFEEASEAADTYIGFFAGLLTQDNNFKE
ncbi:MAG: hypothetical protein ABH826_01875 [Patescibacteria group bacterium]